MKNIYWIPHANPPRLAIVARPRGGDWLNDDLVALKRDGIDILVSLLTAPEEDELGLSGEQETAKAAGLRFVSCPVQDRATPSDLKLFKRLALSLANDIRSGKVVGAHCRGCIGRATVMTAAILVELGWKAKDALALIEKARGCAVPDTAEQQKWIEKYALEDA